MELLRVQVFKLRFVENYLAPSEIVKFWKVWCGHYLRSVPTLASYLPELLCFGSFEGCDLLTNVDEADPDRLLVHPSCQCGYRKHKPLQHGPLADNQREHPRHPPPLTGRATATWPAYSKLIKARRGLARAPVVKVAMPKWVCGQGPLMGKFHKPDDGALSFEKDIGYIVQRDKCAQAPCSTCKLFRRQERAVTDICGALDDALEVQNSFLHSMAEFRSDKGINNRMHALVKAFDCWNWSMLKDWSLLDNNQITQLEGAFADAWGLLHDELQHTFWSPDIPRASHIWPRAPPVNEYRILASKVGAAWTQALASLSGIGNGVEYTDWLVVEHYLVVPVMRLPRLHRADVAFQSLPFKALALIAACIGTPLKTKKLEVSKQSPSKVFKVGTCASIQINDCCSVVVVAKVNPRIVPRAVASTIEGQERFSSSCWMACRCFHRHRRKGAGTQTAESWGHTLSHYHDAEMGHSTGALSQSLILIFLQDVQF